MKTIKLTCGIEITDNREIGCGIRITNIDTKYAELSHSNNHGFYINQRSSWLTLEMLDEYNKEMTMMQEALKEANELFKQS